MADSERKTVLVTGASRGIGRAVLDRLAPGADFAVGTATSKAGAEAVSRRLGEIGAQGTGMVLKAGEPGGVESFMEQLFASRQGVDVLVNNAGIARDALLMRMREEDFDAVMSVNLKAAFTLCKKVLRGMCKQGWGRIVNVSSVVASAGNPGQTVYSASKAALEGLTRSLALEAASRGVTVNAVAPGFIDTDMTRQGISDAVREELLRLIPLGRMAQPAEVAGAVAFLCSDDASYVTGATMHVNGGLYLG